MRNFFFKTLYQKRFMALWWFIGIVAMTVLTVAFYHSFRSTNIEQAFKTLPPAVQKLAGDARSFLTVDGYIRQQVFALRIPMLTIILAISLLVGLSAGDEQKGLLESQLSLPVSRTSLLAQKAAAALLIIAVATLGAVVGIWIGLAILHEKTPWIHVLAYTGNAYCISLVYGFLTFMLAAVTGRRGLALGLGSGFTFLSYLIDTLAPAVSGLNTVDKLTFFHYYQNDPLNPGAFAVLIVTVLVLVSISLLGFRRRDIRTS